MASREEAQTPGLQFPGLRFRITHSVAHETPKEVTPKEVVPHAPLLMVTLLDLIETRIPPLCRLKVEPPEGEYLLQLGSLIQVYTDLSECAWCVTTPEFIVEGLRRHSTYELIQMLLICLTNLSKPLFSPSDKLYQYASMFAAQSIWIHRVKNKDVSMEIYRCCKLIKPMELALLNVMMQKINLWLVKHVEYELRHNPDQSADDIMYEGLNTLVEFFHKFIIDVPKVIAGGPQGKSDTDIQFLDRAKVKHKEDLQLIMTAKSDEFHLSSKVHKNPLDPIIKSDIKLPEAMIRKRDSTSMSLSESNCSLSGFLLHDNDESGYGHSLLLTLKERIIQRRNSPLNKDVTAVRGVDIGKNVLILLVVMEDVTFWHDLMLGNLTCSCMPCLSTRKSTSDNSAEP